MRGSRRYAYDGVYFPDINGLRGALIDLGQLACSLDTFLAQRGLLDAELEPPRPRPRAVPPIPAISVRSGMEALDSAYRVLSNAASVVERVDQAIEQCGLMFDAAVAAQDSVEQHRWATVFSVLVNVAADTCPVPRAQTATARAALRQRKREKVRHSGAQQAKVSSE